MKRTFIAFALLFASTALAVTLNSLPANDAVQKVVGDIALEWRDGNISTGTSAVSAALLSSPVPTDTKGWTDFTIDLFTAEYLKQTGEQMPGTAKLRVSSAPFEEKFIQRAVEAVAEGNAFSVDNPATMKGIEEQTETMVSSLGHERDIHFVAIKTKILQKSAGETRIVRLHAFINVKSGKMIQIFTIEGTM
jgi:hypothetical protein